MIQSSLDDGKHIQTLDLQIMTLVNQVQELKAMYDYQCFKLEQTITELREKLKSHRCKRRPMRRRPENKINTNAILISDI